MTFRVIEYDWLPRAPLHVSQEFTGPHTRGALRPEAKSQTSVPQKSSSYLMAPCRDGQQAAREVCFLRFLKLAGKPELRPIIRGFSIRRRLDAASQNGRHGGVRGDTVGESRLSPALHFPFSVAPFATCPPQCLMS